MFFITNDYPSFLMNGAAYIPVWILIGVIVLFYLFPTAILQNYHERDLAYSGKIKYTDVRSFNGYHAWILVLMVIAIVVLPMSILIMKQTYVKGETQQINHGDIINSKEFKKQIVETAEIDAIKTVDFDKVPEKYKDIKGNVKTEYFKSGNAIEAQGLKDNKKVDIEVVFKKETMEITVLTPEDESDKNTTKDEEESKAKGIEKFSYTP